MQLNPSVRASYRPSDQRILIVDSERSARGDDAILATLDAETARRLAEDILELLQVPTT
jgi:hypothetical protein